MATIISDPSPSPAQARPAGHPPLGEAVARDWRPDSAFRCDLLSAIPALRAFALSLCGDAARSDDLVQEALVRAWANGHLFRPGSNMGAWLCTILRNQFYTAMRRSVREVEDVDGALAGQVAEPPPQEGVIALRGVCATLALLPEMQREALLMVGVEGYTYEEAAKRLGCRVGTIKSRVSRARGRLADPV
jgi:RNA polymerase sigma-70 factor (ECF subfamily)